MDSGASPPRHQPGNSDACPGSSTPPGPVHIPTSAGGEGERQPSSSEPHEHEDTTDSENNDNATSPDSPPPFWTGTSRPLSYQSISQIQRRRSGGPIQLEDHSEEDHVQAQSCWAESATIDEYVVVSGATGIGAYVVWHCTVKTLKGGGLEIRKRYSEFDTLRTNLVRSFPHAENMIPELPRKSVVSRFRPRFLEARKRGLSHFLKYVVRSLAQSTDAVQADIQRSCILLNPEFASSPVLKEFVFS